MYFCPMVRIRDIELGHFPLLLAPMEDVSDPPFRFLCKQGGADLMFTEFISVEGLIRDAEKSFQKLEIFAEERPIGIQIFGAEYDSMIQATDIVTAAQPNLLDINYGCPVKKVVCKNAGAGILRDVDKMVSLTAAVVKRTHLPVTVKTRLGWDENSIRIVEVAERLQDVGVQALSIHARTRAQMYKGDADWTWIKKVKANPRITIPIFGNGDVDTPQKALLYRERYQVDGIMIGRAAIGNPWIFNQIKHHFATGETLEEPGVAEKVMAAKTHLIKSMEWKGITLGVLEMRRHYTNYFKGLENIKTYRSRLVTESDPQVIIDILDEIKEHYLGCLV